MSDATVQSWITTVTGYSAQNVIRADGAGVRPTGNHATYLGIANTTSDYTEFEKIQDPEEDDDVIASFTSASYPTYSISVYAPDGREQLIKLWQSRELLVPRLALAAGNLVLLSHSPINQVPTQGDTIWRRQYHCDFTFRTFKTVSETNQKILEIEFFGEVGDLDTVISEGID